MIRRTLNIPVCVVTVVGLAAAAGGFHVVRNWQLTRLAETFLDRAAGAEARREWLAAAEELDRYLHFAPGDAETRSRLAVDYAKGARSRDQKLRAVALHYRAVAEQTAGATTDLRVQLAELLLQTGRLLEAEGEARTVLQSSPGDAQALRVLALTRYLQWRSGDLGTQRPQDLGLLSDVEAALAVNSKDVALAEIGATIYRDHPAVVKAHAPQLKTLEAQQRADALLDRAVELNPDSAEARLARHLYRVRYRLAGAPQDLERALELGRLNPQVLLVASESRYQQARDALGNAATEHLAARPLDECKEYLTRLVENDLTPDNVQPHLRLGDAHVLAGDLDQALEIWQRGLAKFSQPAQRVVLQARIADHLLRAGRIAEARPPLDAIQEIVEDLGGTIRRQDYLTLMQAQCLRQATYDLCYGRYSEAIDKLHRAIAQQPQLQPNPQTSHAAWDLLGRAYAGLQDWSAAAAAFDRAANFLPTAFSTIHSAAEAWLAAGRLDMAIDRAEQIVLIRPQSLRNDQERRALAQATPGAWLVLATAELQEQSALPLAERTWSRLDAALSRLEEIRKDGGAFAAPWKIDFLQADYLALKSAAEGDDSRDQAAAADVLRRAEAQYQDRPEFWFQACLAYERLQRPEDAERAWQRLNQLPGAQTEATIAAARRASASGDFAHAAGILESAAPSLPLVAQERLRQELIRIAQVQQDLPRMKALYEATLRERPHDAGALCGLAELALRAGDYTKLAEWEAKLALAGSAGQIWAQYFGITRLYSQATGPRDGKLQEALAAQARLATLRPNWAETYVLRGAIEQRLENWDAASDAYQQALQLGERRFSVLEQLVACLDRANRIDDIDRHLARMQSYLPSSQRLTELASARQLEGNRPEQAIAMAQRALALRPKDLDARLWLARLLLLTDRLPEAKAQFEQATKDAPHDARCWTGLFSYHLRVGDHEPARQALLSLEQHAQLSPDRLDCVLSQGYARLGDPAQAIKRLARLIESQNDSIKTERAAAHWQLAQLIAETDREDAKLHLQKALELDPKLIPARWLLATLLALGGSEDDLAAAEQLLGETSGAATASDRRLRAVLLAQHGGDKGLAKAIAMLEQVLSSNPEATTDRLLLAQFYERSAAATTDAAGAHKLVTAAGEQLQAIANRPKATVADWGVLINFLLRHDQKSAAASWLDRLEARVDEQPKADPKAIALLIDLRLAQGAVKRCEPWLARLDAADRDPLRPLFARIRYYAALPNIEAIEPAVEAKARPLYQAAKTPREQTRIARAIGDLYLLVSQLPGAERWYRVVVKADPQQYEPLAVALMRQGRGREAIRLCQTAAELDTTSRPAVILTNLLLEVGAKPDYMQQAEPILAEALRRFPSDVNLLYGVGMLRVLEDRYSDAIALLERVVRLSPHHIAALNNLAVLVAESESTRQEGLALIERAIARRGHQPTLLDTKGTILMWAGQTNEAVTLLEAAARGSTTDPRHSFHLALAYSELGASDHAQRELASALKNKLDAQILTPTDRKALAALQQKLSRPPGNER